MENVKFILEIIKFAEKMKSLPQKQILEMNTQVVDPDYNV